MLTPTLIEVIDTRKLWSPSTKAIYKTSVRSFINTIGTDDSTWTGLDVEKWLQKLQKRGASPKTLNIRLSALRSVVKKWAGLHGRGAYAYDFTAAVDREPDLEESEREPLTKEEVIALYRTCDDSFLGLRDAAILTTLLRTGTRREGLRGLRAIDLKKRPWITITLKGGKRHSFVADPETLSAIDRFLKEREAPIDWIFCPTFEDAPLDPMSINHMLSRRSKQAGIRHIHPHLFRHTFISWALAAGVPDWRVAEITGHTLNTRVVPSLKGYTTDVDVGNPVGGFLPSFEKYMPARRTK